MANPEETKSKRVLWAVDPFVEDHELQKPALGALEVLCKNLNCIVEPVYVILNYNNISLVLDRKLIDETRCTAQARLDLFTGSFSRAQLLPLRILQKAAISRRQAAEDLTDYAKNEAFDLLVLSTHARKGFKRLFMGSFTETIIQYSSPPFLIVNPSWNERHSWKHILYATDFSLDSYLAFQEILPWVKDMGGSITIYHKLLLSYMPSFEEVWGASPLYEHATREDREQAKNNAKKWVDFAKDKGLSTATFIDEKTKESPAEAILRTAEEIQVGSIAMATRSGPFSNVVVGSTTRQVLRNSHIPVWLIHPEASGA